METKEISKVRQNDVKSLVEGIKNALEVIEKLKTETDWTLKNEFKFDEGNVIAILNKMPLNQRKKLKRAINRLIAKQSMRAANLFLSIYHTKFVIYGLTTKFDYSVKEKKIKTARKKYVEARDIAIKLYAEYKEEKGDYYKK